MQLPKTPSNKKHTDGDLREALSNGVAMGLSCPRDSIEYRYLNADIEAIRWAVGLLEIHSGVQGNENSRYWLSRLRKMTEPS